MREYEYHKDDKCPRPGCNEPRFEVHRGVRKHRRVLFYFGIGHVYVDLFLDPEWRSVWKKNMDVSNNSVWKSEHVKKLNELFAQGKLSSESGGLFHIYNDGFTMSINGTNGMTLFGIETLDVPYSHSSKEMNRRPFMLVTPPEPPNTSLILGEAISEINELAERGVMVRHPRTGNPFRYFPFMEAWMADAKARAMLLQLGGPGRLLTCATCGLMSTYLEGTTYYPGAYAYPVVQREYGDMQLKCGCEALQRSHDNMVDILFTVRQAERAAMRGEHGAAARIADLTRYTGAKSGECKLTEIGYVDLRNTVRAPIAHQDCLGLVKADFYPHLYKMLQDGGRAPAERFFRRIQMRTEVCIISLLASASVRLLHVCLCFCLSVFACLCLPLSVPSCFLLLHGCWCLYLSMTHCQELPELALLVMIPPIGKLCVFPSELEDAGKAMLPANVSASTPILSGWMCKVIWNHMETTGVLDTLMFSFGGHEQALLRAEDSISEEIIAFLPTWKVMWLRLASAMLHNLRRGTAVSCTQEQCDADEGLLERTNAKIAHEQELYKYDIQALAEMYEVRVQEKILSPSILSSNLHNAVCVVPREMQRHGAAKVELGMERSVSGCAL